jgi:ribosomal protein S18 acetylase RimI-like enzyme
MAANPDFYFTLVAEQEGHVIGFISLLFYRVWFHPGGTALINELIVDDRYRNQGIGALLIDAAVKEAHSRGMDEIEVGTEQENLGAQRFYRRCGFNETYLLLGMEFE